MKLMGPLATDACSHFARRGLHGCQHLCRQTPRIFMVYAIARGAGVKMPSFFGYMLWSLRHSRAAVPRGQPGCSSDQAGSTT